MGVALIVLFLCIGVGFADLGCPASFYNIYWNNQGPVFSRLDTSEWLINPWNDTATGDNCLFPGCKAWTQGVWPIITDNGAIVNGGVPQAGNLTMHLEYLRTHIDGWLPDTQWAGNAVLDFESWSPIWEQNNDPAWWHGVRYQNLSYHLVAEANPSWNSSRIQAEAKAQFEAAAVEWMSSSLLLLRSLRPNARWGFYGLPASEYSPCVNPFGAGPQCGYRNPVAGPQLRAQNDAVSKIWAASSAIYPSIYIPALQNYSWFNLSNADYISGVSEEAVRLANLYSPDAVVLPFGWNYYHDVNYTLSAADLGATFRNPADVGADGVIMWGNPSPSQISMMFQYLDDVMGPAAKAVVTEECLCSKQRCSGHGLCVASKACKCAKGYAGTDCSSTAALS